MMQRIHSTSISCRISRRCPWWKKTRMQASSINNLCRFHIDCSTAQSRLTIGMYTPSQIKCFSKLTCWPASCWSYSTKLLRLLKRRLDSYPSTSRSSTSIKPVSNGHNQSSERWFQRATSPSYLRMQTRTLAKHIRTLQGSSANP